MGSVIARNIFHFSPSLVKEKTLRILLAASLSASLMIAASPAPMAQATSASVVEFAGQVEATDFIWILQVNICTA